MSRIPHRLSPEEVREALAAKAAQDPASAPAGPFNNPFAQAAATLAQVKVKKPPVVRERQSDRREPSELSVARARHRAQREALSDAVRPMVRPPRKPGDGDR